HVQPRLDSELEKLFVKGAPESSSPSCPVCGCLGRQAGCVVITYMHMSCDPRMLRHILLPHSRAVVTGAGTHWPPSVPRAEVPTTMPAWIGAWRGTAHELTVLLASTHRSQHMRAHPTEMAGETGSASCRSGWSRLGWSTYARASVPPHPSRSRHLPHCRRYSRLSPSQTM